MYFWSKKCSFQKHLYWKMKYYSFFIYYSHLFFNSDVHISLIITFLNINIVYLQWMQFAISCQIKDEQFIFSGSSSMPRPSNQINQNNYSKCRQHGKFCVACLHTDPCGQVFSGQGRRDSSIWLYLPRQVWNIISSRAIISPISPLDT